MYNCPTIYLSQSIYFSIRMRKAHYYLLIILLCSCTTYVYGQSKDLKAISGVLARQEKAWNNGDLVGFMNGYWQSDSLCFIGKRGLTYGWEATLANYKKSYPDTNAMGKLTFTLLRTEKISSKAYYVIGKWKLTRTNDTLEGHFTLLWKKIKGQWVIVADHSS